jgi:uncharacterized DUF497 family protein
LFETRYRLWLVDAYFQLREHLFVWDKKKAASNIRKHGISFELAAEALIDPFVKHLDAGVPDEDRIAAVGEAFDETLLYVNLEREDLVVRIISAREATPRERRIYENRE